jgi:uncharacterized protein
MMPRLQSTAPLSGHFPPVALAALCLAAWIGASPAAGQSFDCRNARYPDEKTICRESRLGALDKELAAAYDRAEKKLSKQEREEFENNETAFVNARHRCGENQGCIEQSYRNRRQELGAVLRDEEADRSGRRGASSMRIGRQKPSPRDGTEERVKIENERAEPRDAELGAAETASPSSDRKTEPSDATPPRVLLPPSPAEARSRHKETGKTGSPAATPPSREEAEAAIAGIAVPEKRHRHEKRDQPKDGVSAVSPTAPPEHEKQSTNTGNAVPERYSPASGGSAAAASPAQPSEKPHSKAKAVAAGAPTPAEPPPGAKPAGGGGTQWVNPSPSP